MEPENQNQIQEEEYVSIRYPIVRESHRYCDFCERPLSDEIIKTEEHLYFCRSCFTNLYQLQGSLRETITRFMLGNVI